MRSAAGTRRERSSLESSDVLPRRWELRDFRIGGEGDLVRDTKLSGMVLAPDRGLQFAADLPEFLHGDFADGAAGDLIRLDVSGEPSSNRRLDNGESALLPCVEHAGGGAPDIRLDVDHEFVAGKVVHLSRSRVRETLRVAEGTGV